MTIEEQKIVDLAFYDELEKNAQFLATAFKGLSKLVKPLGEMGLKSFGKLTNYFEGAAGAAAKKGGILPYLSKFKNPGFIVGKDGSVTKQVVGDAFSEANNGFLQKLTGDMAHRLTRYGEGLSGQTGLMGKAKQLGKNFSNLTKEEFANARYRVVDPTKKGFFGFGKQPEFFQNKGNTYMKGRGIFADKQVLNPNYKQGMEAIVKRSPGGAFLEKGMTPVGMGLTSLGMSTMMGKPGEGAKQGLKDFAAWSTPYGMTKMTFYELPKMVKDMIFKKNKQMEVA